MVINEVLGVVIALILGGYLLSGYLHPYRPCRTCNGSGVHRGAFYRRATRECPACGGRKQYRRAGAPPKGHAFGESRR